MSVCSWTRRTWANNDNHANIDPLSGVAFVIGIPAPLSMACVGSGNGIVSKAPVEQTVRLRAKK